jgi:uncharacterized protein
VFLTMEADHLPWVLAARAARLPYRWSRIGLVRDLHDIDYRSTRRWPGPIGIGTHIRLRVGPPTPGNALDHFLTARRRLHHRVGATTVTAQLAHTPGPCTPPSCSASTTTSLKPPDWLGPTGPPPACSTPPPSAAASAYLRRAESRAPRRRPAGIKATRSAPGPRTASSPAIARVPASPCTHPGARQANTATAVRSRVGLGWSMPRRR